MNDRAPCTHTMGIGFGSGTYTRRGNHDYTHQQRWAPSSSPSQLLASLPTGSQNLSPSQHVFMRTCFHYCQCPSKSVDCHRDHDTWFYWMALYIHKSPKVLWPGANQKKPGYCSWFLLRLITVYRVIQSPNWDNTYLGFVIASLEWYPYAAWNDSGSISMLVNFNLSSAVMMILL